MSNGPSPDCGLPWAPLDAWLTARGFRSIAEQSTATGVCASSISRWRTGRHRISTWTADEIAVVHFGVLPSVIWPDDWSAHRPSPDFRNRKAAA